MAIPLCVSFDDRAQASAAGATWNKVEKRWECEPTLREGNGYAALRRFLPRMYRRENDPPHIRPYMIPQTSWGKNLRAVLQDEDWKRVRQHAYNKAGRRCLVCGGVGSEWPVEADEAWAYDEVASTQTLKGVIALCTPCHLVRHWGNATVKGKTNIAIEQMMYVNNWTRGQAEAAGVEGMRLWEFRSQRHWKIDYSWVTREHGIVVNADGLDRAEVVNRKIVDDARSSRGSL